MKAYGKTPPDRIAIGKITRTQGRKGEVFAQILTDFPQHFESLSTVFLKDPRGSLTVLSVENSWLHKKGVVLKLGGVDTISMAETCVGSLIQIDHEDLTPLPGDTYYCFDLEGCHVFDEDGEPIGCVKSVDDHNGNMLLAVETVAGKEILVPAARQYLRDIQVTNKRIVMRLPAELVALNP